MAKYKKVESTVKPLEREINANTYYLRRNIKLIEGDGEDIPDMYVYEEAEVTPQEYIIETENSFNEKLNEILSKLQSNTEGE